MVIRLDNSVLGLNAGMSVEVSIEEPLISGGSGFLLPLSVLVPEEGGKELQSANMVFLYDSATLTVKKHTALLRSAEFATTVWSSRRVLPRGISSPRRASPIWSRGRG